MEAARGEAVGVNKREITMRKFCYSVCVIMFFNHCFDKKCLAVQEPNGIDFKDQFYAEVLKSSIDEVYLTESGEIPDYAKISFQESIIEESHRVKQKYTSMIVQWYKSNLSPLDYQEAALIILSHLELNEKRLLTFGTIVTIFGIPDEIYFCGYCSDEFGTIASEQRFVARYEKRDIAFKFSVTGFCSDVHIYSSIENRGIKRWPQNYAYSKENPILCNFKQGDELYKKLCEEIEIMKREKPGYYDWVSYMERWPKDHKVPYAKRQVDIMMVDRILDNVVIVYLKVTGNKETLYCDTWWKSDADKWVLLNDEQVSLYFEISPSDNKKSENPATVTVKK
ncbi:hypothetical protein JW824_13480 [bacterium]|nr:hypothetical protein [bacterium]